jgi:hypothetical protein
MAPVERDGAQDVSSIEDQQPRARRNLSNARSDKPVFTSLHHREHITFGKKDRARDENARPAPESGGRGNWMSGNGMRLGEAFERIDPEGNFVPRPSSGSRIPRTKSFSPPGVSPSPSNRAGSVLITQGRDKRSASAPADSESESTGPLQGSPSPAARNRRENRGSRGAVVQTSAGEDSKLDEFDRKIQQYADDQERLGALRSRDSPPLFTRARVGPRVEETTRTLKEKMSVNSFENEPPISVPKSWGSKAKKNTYWMAKIMSPDTSLEIKDPLEDAPSPERAAADIPLPSVEDVSSIQTFTPPASRPASARPTNMSPEKSQMWNADLDFTAQSLQISTSPQLRVKPTKLDEIRAREIESLTARAVATNRLEDIREKLSEERSIAEDAVPTGPDSKAAQQEPGSPEEELSILERNGYLRDNSGSTNERMAKAAGRRTSNARASDDIERGTSQSEGHDETWETLRALSRVLRKSPSPAPMNENEADAPTTTFGRSGEKATERQPGTKREFSSRGTALDSDVKRNTGTSTPPKSDVDPEERITAEARLFELQDNKSERNSIRVPSRSPSPSDEEDVEQTPRPPKIDPLLLPTPKVTGAYIETPAPTNRKSRKARSIPPSRRVEVTNDAVSSSERKSSESAVGESSGAVRNARLRQRQLSRQSRPLFNSAKPTTVSEDLRRIKQEAQLDDSTLDDFDAILEAHTRATVESENDTVLEPIIDLEYDEHGLPLSAKEIARRVELLTLDRMFQSIKNTSSSIRDARHGIERLEHQVSTSVTTSAKEDTRHYIVIPIPRLITRTSPKRPGLLRRNWKFTWFGLMLAVFTSWYITESILCAEFCHFDQSRNPHRYTYTDPFFPWTIPTKLDQWTGSVASDLFWDAWVALGGERPSMFPEPPPWPGMAGIVRDEEYAGTGFSGDETI